MYNLSRVMLWYSWAIKMWQDASLLFDSDQKSQKHFTIFL